MLFTGDIEEIAEKQILQEYKNNLGILNANILKVRTSRLKKFKYKRILASSKPQNSTNWRRERQ